MSLAADLKILYRMAANPGRGRNHAERLESFYAGQAATYDDFRRRLLQGRRELWEAIPTPEQGVWVDLGGGTGANLELLGSRIDQLRKVYVVDLSPSLLTVARERIAARGWTNVEAVRADAVTFRPPTGTADVVTFSYSLTMIPDWFAVIDNAWEMLKPGGLVGVVDFYVARKYPAESMAQHDWWTRSFWPVWFGRDNVFLSPDHVPYLQRKFEPMACAECRSKVPYLPCVRVPYYRFLGRRGS